MGKSIKPVSDKSIERRIVVIRGQNVMLDFHIAELYDVTTKALNQQVTRHRDRFPEDFMFRLTAEEIEELNRSQFVTGSQKHRDPRYPPRAFTQEGLAMLSSVLNSKQAIAVNIQIMRTFVRLRQAISANKDLARRLDKVEHELGRIEKEHGANFRAVFDAIRKLMEPPPVPSKRQIGYIEHEEKD